MENNKKYIRVKRYKWPDEIAEEKKKTKQTFITILICLLCFGLGLGVSNLNSDASTVIQNTQANSKFEEIYATLETDWLFGKDIENLQEFLIDQAVSGLTNTEYDQHTNYLNPEQASAYLDSLAGNFVGVGIVYAQQNGHYIVSQVYANSPAKEGGIQPGDRILAFNGIEIEGKTTDEVSELALGEEGTSINITVLRGNETITFDLIRRSISTTVFGYIEEGVGVLEISSFSENTYDEVESFIEEFNAAGIKSIVIDLRDNSGGYLSTCVNIAGLFLDKNSIVLIELNRQDEEIEYKTNADPLYTGGDVVILVNEGTASAAEAFSAALQEHGMATIVGTQTYGKGTVQNSKLFEDGSYLKYTTAEWLTPNKEHIHNVGITPDVVVELDEALTHTLSDDETVYQVDSVGLGIQDAQMYLSLLGYDVDRRDGYYSQKTLVAVNAYRSDLGLEVNGLIDSDFLVTLLSSAQEKYYVDQKTLDTQRVEAFNLAKQ